MKSRKTITVTVILTALLLASIILLGYAATWPRYYRSRLYGRMNNELMDSDIYEDMAGGSSFCFVGDSITCGSMIWGITWYDPLKPYISGEINNFSHSGWNSKDIASMAGDIPSSDVYVIAIGVNDVLSESGAATAQEYISNMEVICGSLHAENPSSKIYCITPWPLIDQPDDINERRVEYSESLQEWCNGTDIICIDPCPVIMSVMGDTGSGYMWDNVHPNFRKGVGLYSYAVLMGDHMRRG